jgi:hypothetical protein
MSKADPIINNPSPTRETGTGGARSVADQAFDRARRRAFIQDMLAPMRNQAADLLPFEEVRRRLNLGSQTYKGIQSVPLDQIVGSVARYHDFNRAFRPRHESLRQRWQRAMKQRVRFLPVDLYQVGEVFFVVDGNHRVSVARQIGARSIDANVWEYPTRVPVESNDNLDDIFIRQEYLEFLEQSRLDINRPQQRIIFTVPGAYRQLGEELAQHREWLDRQHIYTVSFEEAAADWYDTVYQPMVEVVREREILGEFPGRTEADLVAYILRYRDELQQEWGESPPTAALSLVDQAPPDNSAAVAEQTQRSSRAAQEFVIRARQDWWSRLVAWVKRKILGWEVLDRGPGGDPS